MDIEPIVLRTKSESLRSSLRIAALAAALTSLPWAWAWHAQRDRVERLVAATLTDTLRVEAIVIRYANGVTARVEVRHEPEEKQ